jgi:hypothetical protein
MDYRETEKKAVCKCAEGGEDNRVTVEYKLNSWGSFKSLKREVRDNDKDKGKSE